jgi:hypothetical protein
MPIDGRTSTIDEGNGIIAAPAAAALTDRNQHSDE